MSKEALPSKNEEEQHKDESIETPYGWVVAVSSFIIVMMVIGCTIGYGIIYVEFLEYFQQSRSKTSGVAALCQLFLSFGGVVCSWTTPRFGHRVSVMVGAVVASTGIFCSGFAPNVFFLYGTYGIMGGFGFGLCLVGSISIVAKYFDKRLSLASGLALAGGGVSYFVFPIIVKASIEAYSVRGAMIILSCVWLQGCVFGALMRPPPSRQVDVCSPETVHDEKGLELDTRDPDTQSSKSGDEEKLTLYSCSDKPRYKLSEDRDTEGSCHPQCKETPPSLDKMETDPDSRFLLVNDVHPRKEADGRHRSEKCWQCCTKKCLKGSIMLEWKFWMFAVITVLYRIDYYNFVQIAADFALVTGHSRLQAVILMNIIGACLIPSRVIGGVILDRPWSNVFIVLIGNLLVFSATSLAFPFSREIFWLMAVTTGLRSVIQGMLGVVPVQMGVTLFGVERITSFLAYINMFRAFGDLTSAPLAAIIYDNTGDYLPVYVTCSCITTIAAGLTFVLYLHSKGIFTKSRRGKGK